MLYFAFWWLIAIKSTYYLGFQDYTLYELTIVNPALYHKKNMQRRITKDYYQ